MEPELFNLIEVEAGEEPALAELATEPAQSAPSEGATSHAKLELLNQALVRQLLDPALQKAPLTGLKAQLLIFEGQYLLHYRTESGAEASAEKFKFISPEAVRLAFSASPVDSGWLGAGICRWGAVREGNWLVKFFPPKDNYLLQLKLPDHQGQPKTNTASMIEVALPGLVFMGIGQNYYLWAIKEAEFRPEAHLYAAPLPNLYQDGRICWGQNLPPAVSAQTIETAWQLFISSEFSEHLVQGKSRAFSQDVRHQLLTLGEANNPTPVDENSEGKPSHPKKKARPKGERGYPLGDLVAYTEGWGSGATPATVGRAVDQLLTRHG